MPYGYLRVGCSWVPRVHRRLEVFMGVPCGHRRAEVLMGVPCGHRRAGRTGAGRGAHMIVQPGLGGRPALRQCSLGDARVLRRRQMLAAQLGQTAPPTLSFNACAKGVSGRRGREPAPARPSGRIRVAPAHIGPRTSLRARRPLTPTRSRLSSETGRFAAARCLRHAWPRGQVDSPQLGVCVMPGLGDRSIRRSSVSASRLASGTGRFAADRCSHRTVLGDTSVHRSPVPTSPVLGDMLIARS